MVKHVRIYRNNNFILIPVEDYLNEYRNNIPEGWEFYCTWVDKIYKIQPEFDYQNLAMEIQVEKFNVSKIKESYFKLRDSYSFFDDDILRFMAFLTGTSYFSRIGDPTFEQWINAIDINHPFKENESQDIGFSILEALKYQFGQNEIRKRLMSTIKWISSQSGA